METDFEFPERRDDLVRARRRVKLCFLALLACVIMMADLISGADAAVRTQHSCQDPVWNAPIEDGRAQAGAGLGHCH